jgi:hypothetical protein
LLRDEVSCHQESEMTLFRNIPRPLVRTELKEDHS